MADETIIGKALALLPGGHPARKLRPSAKNHAAQLAAVQKNLAKLQRDVDALVQLIAARGPPDRPKPSRRRRAKPAKKESARIGAKGRGA